MKRVLAPWRLAAALFALVTTLTVSVALAGASEPAPPLYTIVDLGALGDSYSAAQAISNSGQVVGESNGHAFSWSQARGMIDLGSLGNRSSALGVNDNGQVFGLSYTSSGYYPHAFFWTESSGMVDIGTLGGSLTTPNGMNASGQIVGFSSTGSTASHAFSWTPGGGMLDLGTLGGAGSVALGVNDAGTVFGTSDTASGATHFFSWTLGGGMVDLGALGTLGGPSSFAFDVNDNGQFVGLSAVNDQYVTHAFSWTQADGIVDLGTLAGTFSSPARSLSILLRSVNDNGQVVGSSDGHAFSWTKAGGMLDLGTLGGSYSTGKAVGESGDIVGTRAVPSGGDHAFAWTQAGGMVDLPTLGGQYTNAVAVNASGQIVGDSNTADFRVHATLWQPRDTTPPVPPSIDLMPMTDSGSSDIDNITNRQVLTFTGTAESGSMVTLYRDATAIMTTSASPPSGLWWVNDFVLADGTYRYSATATDPAGNTSAMSEPLVVTRDGAPPTLSIPGPISVDATSPLGAIVTYAVPVSDNVDPSPLVTCTPASGAAFAIGATVVTCFATDTAGNGTSNMFTVTVKGAPEQLADLATAVKGVGPGKSLAATVATAQWFLAHDQIKATCLTLTAFNLEVKAQSGKKIPKAQATALIADANRIRAVLGC